MRTKSDTIQFVRLLSIIKALLRDKLKYLEPEEAKQQLRKCMKEIGELKAERCKAIGAIGIP